MSDHLVESEKVTSATLRGRPSAMLPCALNLLMTCVAFLEHMKTIRHVVVAQTAQELAQRDPHHRRYAAKTHPNAVPPLQYLEAPLHEGYVLRY